MKIFGSLDFEFDCRVNDTGYGSDRPCAVSAALTINPDGMVEKATVIRQRSCHSMHCRFDAQQVYAALRQMNEHIHIFVDNQEVQ